MSKERQPSCEVSCKIEWVVTLSNMLCLKKKLAWLLISHDIGPSRNPNLNGQFSAERGSGMEGMERGLEGKDNI